MYCTVRDFILQLWCSLLIRSSRMLYRLGL